MPRTLLNADEVCARLGITRAALNQMYYRGDAPPRIARSPRRFLWDEGSLDTWLKEREQAGTRESVA